MTKVEAVKEFIEFHKPQVLKQYGPHDRPAMREAWNNYTDYLCKDGQITDKQYATWTGPFP